MPTEIGNATRKRGDVFDVTRERERQAVAECLSHGIELSPWELPALDRSLGRYFFALKDFNRHMTDESWQFQLGMEAAGYMLVGKGFPVSEQDCRRAMAEWQIDVALVADRREWDASRAGCFDKTAAFANLEALDNLRVFRGTIVKDMWRDHEWTRAWHKALNPHVYLHYYNPQQVMRLYPWIRPEQLIRIWHTLDADKVPEVNYEAKQDVALLSGATGWAYPLRTRLFQANLPNVHTLRHPGYGNTGSHSQRFLEVLCRYKVAICTSSIFCCTLRKPIEATACGCVVITDLPPEEAYPAIDGNMVRVPCDITDADMKKVVDKCIREYDPARQAKFAVLARRTFDYLRVASFAAYYIEEKRREWV